MVKLYEITEAQAEAMSPSHAIKILAQQEEEEGEGYGEAWDRDLEGYALDAEDGEPLEDDGWLDVPEAPKLWRHWSKILSKEEMKNLSVGEALSLHPKVKSILERKVEDTLGKFKEHASEKTKAKWEKSTDVVKDAILRKWLKAHGHPSFDGGRRKTRRSRGRRTTRKH